MEDGSWPADWIRAAMPAVVLAVVAEGDTHGYALLQRLRSSGFADLGGSTLYPLLSRQVDSGRLDACWDTEGAGPARRVFTITELGRRDLAALTDSWQRFTEVVQTRLTTDQ